VDCEKSHFQRAKSIKRGRKERRKKKKEKKKDKPRLVFLSYKTSKEILRGYLKLCRCGLRKREF